LVDSAWPLKPSELLAGPGVEFVAVKTRRSDDEGGHDLSVLVALPNNGGLVHHRVLFKKPFDL
jgi:hypothetical protein